MKSPRMTPITIILLVAGLVLLVFSADWLVKGAAKIAAAVGISPLVVGLTVVAFGTSAPELAVSVMSAFEGKAELAVGNVVGSNIFNILVILGISALIIPLVVNQQLIRFDVPVMIALSFLLYGLSFDGAIGRADGILLFALAISYTVFLIRQSKKESNAKVLTEYEQEYGKEPGKPEWLKNLSLIVVGIGGLVLGSKWLVDGAVEIATHFGVSELIIGLTIVSVGTSLPEVATSVVAALKGERDIAVGNVVGSNIFNIVVVLGLASIIAPNGIAVPKEALAFDIPVMIAVALAALPIFFIGYKIGRLGATFFLIFYGAYLAHLILYAPKDGVAPAYGLYHQVMVQYVAPVAGLILLGVLYRAFKQPKILA
jgi:cation:H+ antiporter